MIFNIFRFTYRNLNVLGIPIVNSIGLFHCNLKLFTFDQKSEQAVC